MWRLILLLLAAPLALAEAAPGLQVDQAIIAVAYRQGRSGHPTDWAGLYRVGDPATAPLQKKYLNNTTKPPKQARASGTLTFTLPAEAGRYEVRLYADGKADTLLSTSPVVTRGTLAPACEAALTGVCAYRLVPGGLVTTFE